MALAVAALALVLGTRALAAPSAVSTVLLLHGHLPDLGDAASLRVFQSADAYDAFHRALGPVDIFPAASALSTSFDRYVVVLYARGADTANRCLDPRGAAAVNGDTVELALAWEDGTCGAPATAHYPFVLVALSRTANDGSAWLGALRSVCAAAPGVDASRACAAVGGAVATAVPKSAVPTSLPASAGAPAPVPAAATQRTEPVSAPAWPVSALVVGLVGIGIILGVMLAALYTRWRRAHGARTGVTREADVPPA